MIVVVPSVSARLVPPPVVVDLIVPMTELGQVEQHLHGSCREYGCCRVDELGGVFELEFEWGYTWLVWMEVVVIQCTPSVSFDVYPQVSVAVDIALAAIEVQIEVP